MDEEARMTGQRLRQWRKEAEMTQADLAKRVKVSVNSVARWERGEQAISPAMAEYIRLILKGG